MPCNFLSKGDVVILFPEEKVFVFCSEGTGDNLLDSDLEEGYVDYINMTSYSMTVADPPEFDEIDGGMALFKEYVADLSDKDLIDAIRYEMDIKSKSYIVL